MHTGQIQGSPLPPIAERPAPKPDAAAGASFGTELENALRSADQQMQAGDAQAASFTAGQGGDLHNVILGMEQADLSFRLMVQVRNKLLEAYQEIMRIQI